jgi:antitoxin (DNA-binding transcriptional repressor) of toxin-antitoxin stability system
MTVSVQHAQADLLGLIRRLPPGETLTLTDNDLPVATLTPTAPAALRPPPGLWKGKVLILSEDDEHLKAFEEYVA